MRRFAIVYATVAMVEPSQQQLHGMVLATVRTSWRQSHAGVQLVPGFWGLRGVARTPLRPLVASLPLRMAVPSLGIGLPAATRLKSSTDAFGRREASAEPQRTAIGAASAPSANSQEERPSRAASSRRGTSAPRPSLGPHKKTRPWRTGLDFLSARNDQQERPATAHKSHFKRKLCRRFSQAF
jgi:hypothetical protein